jgi:hypothetical protein
MSWAEEWGSFLKGILKDSLALAFIKTLGAAFAAVSAIMLVAPAFNLQQDGVIFDAFPVAGKAEVRAYYVGTALTVSWACLCCELHVALKAIQVVLFGFWGSRVVGYALDGVDADAALRLHQHAVFFVEVFGCAIATLFLDDYNDAYDFTTTTTGGGKQAGGKRLGKRN